MVQAFVGNHEITIIDEERQICEVWTRVMGYYRPVSEFNIGKKSEHAERVHFQENTVPELHKVK
jgi:anaerobic ribonucleoside-triphosphate reductase